MPGLVFIVLVVIFIIVSVKKSRQAAGSTDSRQRTAQNGSHPTPPKNDARPVRTPQNDVRPAMPPKNDARPVTPPKNNRPVTPQTPKTAPVTPPNRPLSETVSHDHIVLDRRSYVDEEHPMLPQGKGRAAKRHEEWMAVPKGHRIVNCSYCGAANEVAGGNLKEYKCYFCWKQL